MARLKAKQAKADSSVKINEIKTIVGTKGEILPDNSDIMAARKARRLAHQQAEETLQSAVENSAEMRVSSMNEKTAEKSTALEDKKAAVAAALARAKVKKLAAQQNEAEQGEAEKDGEVSAAENVTDAEKTVTTDPKKVAVAAAIARAKAKKLAVQQAKDAE